jgi:hypothetical protein
MTWQKGHKPYPKKSGLWDWAYAKLKTEERTHLHDCLSTTFSGDDAPMLGNLLNRWARIPEGTRWIGVSVPEPLPWKRAETIVPFMLVMSQMLVTNRAQAECDGDIEQAVALAVKDMAVLLAFARP